MNQDVGRWTELGEGQRIRGKKRLGLWEELLYLIDKHGGEAELPDALYSARHRADVSVSAADGYFKDFTSSEGPLQVKRRSDGRVVVTRRTR